MGYRSNPNPQARTTLPPPPPGRAPQFDIVNPRTGPGDFRMWLLGFTGLATAATGVAGYDALAGAILAIGGALTAGPTVLRRLRQPSPPDPEPAVEAEEPLDTCGHGAEAVPVEVDVNGDGEKDIVAWLCDQCGAKVSEPRPTYGWLDAASKDATGKPESRLDELRRAYAEKRSALTDMLAEIETDPVVISHAQVRAIEHVEAEVHAIKRAIDRGGSSTTYYQPRAPRGCVAGDIWVDTDDGNAMYRWDGSAWRSAEVTEVRSHASDFPTRRIIG